MRVFKSPPSRRNLSYVLLATILSIVVTVATTLATLAEHVPVWEITLGLIAAGTLSGAVVVGLYMRATIDDLLTINRELDVREMLASCVPTAIVFKSRVDEVVVTGDGDAV